MIWFLIGLIGVPMIFFLAVFIGLFIKAGKGPELPPR